MDTLASIKIAKHLMLGVICFVDVLQLIINLINIMVVEELQFVQDGEILIIFFQIWVNVLLI